MATVSSLGSGSGLDLSGLLTKLMTAEQQPLLQLQTKEASYQSKISAYGTLQGVLSSLQTAAEAWIPSTGTSVEQKFSTFSAAVADTTIATASATTGAVAGSYSLEVQSIAKSQRLVSAQGTYTNGASSSIGTGSLTIEFGKLAGTTYTSDSTRKATITIDSTNNTLGGLRDAINKANIGATATIVTGTSGSQLVLTSKSTGQANVMKLSGSLSGFSYDPATSTGDLSESSALGGQSASDAQYSLNGVSGTSSSNTVTGALDGVTLTLSKQTTSATTLTVSQNKSSALTSAVNAFVTAYNTANSKMKELGAYNASTKTAGALQGNATLRTAQSQVRNLLFGSYSAGTYQNLANIGVSVAKDGSLSVDSTKLSAAIDADFSNVANLVSSAGSAFKKTLSAIAGTSGTIASATDGANRVIKSLTAQQEAMQTRLTQIEARYRKQFTALDTTISGMNQTSTYLTQQLSSLANLTSSN